MFIFDKTINSLINADKIREIETKKWKENGKWKEKTIAHFDGDAASIEIDDYIDTILSFHACEVGYEVVCCHYDDTKKEAWISHAPIIGWVEVLGGGIKPFTLDLEVPKDERNTQRWALRKYGDEKIFEPFIGWYPTEDLYKKSCHEDFTKEK